jgi:ABC-type multidrug transport system fused ATPase/permease subunit
VRPSPVLYTRSPTPATVLVAVRHAASAYHETSKRDSPNETKTKEKQNKTIPDSNSNLTKSMTHHNQIKELTTWFLIYTSAMLLSIFFGVPAFVAMITFGSCIALGIPLETGKVLSPLATFRQLQNPIHGIPDTISAIIQTKVSLDRICSSLCLEELSSDAVIKLPKDSTDASILVTNGHFSWDTFSQVPTLRDLNFCIQQGMKVAICGTVGSGKSSLLSCILGEIPKLSGDVQVCGRIAYVSQSPWIQSGKVEENILFGTKMGRERYVKVLEACSLIKDLAVLPLGDQTIIGERGINLSGGQKQRIQIARALYHDADIFLFDDPFSAVDAHTGLHLFKVSLVVISETSILNPKFWLSLNSSWT